MNLVDYIFGQRLDPNLSCAWCKKPIGMIEHYPIPVCTPCFNFAYAHHLPPDNVWGRLMDEFRKPATYWAKRIQTMHTETQLFMHAGEASMDVVEMSQEALRLSREGKREEATRMRQQAERRKQEADKFRAEIPAWVRHQGRDDE